MQNGTDGQLSGSGPSRIAIGNKQMMLKQQLIANASSDV